MMSDIVAAQPLEGHKLNLRFEDGSEGVVDVSQLVRFHGVFEPLKDLAYFRLVRVDPDSGTITWPNGADLDPDVLYSRATGTPISLEPQNSAV